MSVAFKLQKSSGSWAALYVSVACAMHLPVFCPDPGKWCISFMRVSHLRFEPSRARFDTIWHDARSIQAFDKKLSSLFSRSVRWCRTVLQPISAPPSSSQLRSCWIHAKVYHNRLVKSSANCNWDMRFSSGYTCYTLTGAWFTDLPQNRFVSNSVRRPQLWTSVLFHSLYKPFVHRDVSGLNVISINIFSSLAPPCDSRPICRRISWQTKSSVIWEARSPSQVSSTSEKVNRIRISVDDELAHHKALRVPAAS